MVRARVADYAADFLTIGTDKDERWRVNHPPKASGRRRADFEADQGSETAFRRCGIGSADLFMPQIAIPAALALDHDELQTPFLIVGSRGCREDSQDSQHCGDQEEHPARSPPVDMSRTEADEIRLFDMAIAASKDVV